MKIVGIFFFLAALYYLGWFLTSGQVGSEIGFINLLVAGSIFYLLSNTHAPEKKWFSAKQYGYGWGLPTVWQGWVVYGVFVFASILTTVVIAANTHSIIDTIIGLLPTLGLLIATLIAICFKYGETPKWRWGKKNPPNPPQ